MNLPAARRFALPIAAFASLLILPAISHAEDKPGAGAPKSAGKDTPAPAGSIAAKEETAPLPEIVAVVDGVPIKKGEFEKVLKQVAGRRGAPPNAPTSEAQRAQEQRAILDNMIADKLLDEKSAKTPVTDAEFASQFDKFKARYDADPNFKMQVEAVGDDLASVKESLRSSIRKQHWVEDQLKDKIQVSDADAEKFYKENTKQFAQPEQVRASHILLKLEKDAAPAAVEAKQKEAQAITDRAKKGEDFAAMAKELSEDPSAKENGGDLNFFTRERMVPEFSQAAFEMKTGEISDPVRSSFGLHVIKVTDRKPAGTVSFEEIKPKLIAFLRQQKMQAEARMLIQELRSKATVTINLPAPAEPVTSATPPLPLPAPGEKTAPAAK